MDGFSWRCCRSFLMCALLVASFVQAQTMVESPTPAVSSAGVLLQDIGVQMDDGTLVPLLYRGCQAPCSVNHVLSPLVAGQSAMQLRLYRYASGALRNATSLGRWSVTGISVQDGVSAQVALVLLVRRDGLAVQAIDLRTRQSLFVQRSAQ